MTVDSGFSGYTSKCISYASGIRSVNLMKELLLVKIIKRSAVTQYPTRYWSPARVEIFCPLPPRTRKIQTRSAPAWVCEILPAPAQHPHTSNPYPPCTLTRSCPKTTKNSQLGQVFVAIKSWEIIIYFMKICSKKLSLCTSISNEIDLLKRFSYT